MIALNRDHQARDAAFAQTRSWTYMKVVRLIPMCCGEPMLQTGGSDGRKRYYKCALCKAKASGTTTRERLP